MSSRLLQRKPLERFFEEAEGRAGAHALKRVLGPLDLVMLGIGGIIGTGIFVLTGVAAVDHAGAYNADNSLRLLGMDEEIAGGIR